MIRITFNSLWSHKRRLISTCIAVILGVAFMAGTLVLTSTINHVFDDLFAGLGKGTDAQVRGPVVRKTEQQGAVRALLDAKVVDEIRRVPGVAAAQPSVQTFQLVLLDKKGGVQGGTGPPTIVGSWDPDKQLNPYQVVEGRAPRADDEAVIDRAAANDGPFKVGDKITLLTADGRTRMKVVGITKFGDADSAGGSIYIGTTVARAQKFTGEPNKVNEISVRAEPGIAPAQLVSRLRQAHLTGKTDIVTGEQAAKEQASEIKKGFSFFSIILLIFAGVALFVGAFIISNTFGILVAQRTKELALLRAVGASRSQVLGSVMLEAVVIGVFSALVGLVAGIGLAGAALAALKAFGLDLPSAALVVTPGTALISLVVGLSITLVAAVNPALRATRVPPIAALRDVAIDTSGSSRIRAIVGAVLFVLSLVLMAPALDAGPGKSVVKPTGVGMALMILSVLVLGPVLARPLARVVSAFLPKLKGVTGTIARENAMRSPRRTASTASALIIGVTLIGFITVFASSAQASISAAVGTGFEGDYVVRPVSQFGGGVSPKVGTAIAALHDVAEVSPQSFSELKIAFPDGRDAVKQITAIDDHYGDLWRTKTTTGNLEPLPITGVAVSEDEAKGESLALGDKVTITGDDNRHASFEVTAITKNAVLLGNYAISKEALAKLVAKPTDVLIAVKTKPGASDAAARREIDKVLKPYPTVKLQDRDQFTSGVVKQISQILNVIYALLAVSVLIALIGIANTLSLSIHERTRELGLLRAMGMTRAQLRSAVRWEAAIVALVGTAVGLLLGVGLSWILVKALVTEGITEFSVPVSGMVTVVLSGAALGVLAAVRPAWKAARLNVLEAIATE